MCKVSVIIPTYNRKELLPRSVESVLNQSYKDFELIIVDDASTDGTKDVVDGFKDERIKYIRLEQNAGAAAARNSGIEVATGQYIAFQDSDDEWYPEKLRKQVACLDSAGDDVGIVFCRYLYINEYLNLKGVCPSENINNQDIDFSNLLYKNHIGAPTMLVRRECLYQVGGFDAGLRCLEDYDLILAITENYKAIMVDEVLVTAHGYENGVSLNLVNYFNARLVIFNRYKSKIIYYGLENEIKKDIISRAEESGFGEKVKEKLESILNSHAECDKKVSVVVPCNDCEEYIKECLNSIETQTLKKEYLEIILVNNASKDNTLNILLEFEKRFNDSVLVINLPQKVSFGEVKNTGLSYASGEYVSFLYPEYNVVPTAYEKLYNISKENNVDILLFNTDDIQKVEDNRLLQIDTVGERKNLLSSFTDEYSCENIIFRTEVLSSVDASFSDSSCYEDMSFVYPFYYYVKRLYYLSEILFVHHHTGKEGEKAPLKIKCENQISLIKDILKRKWIVDSFYDEVSAHFLWNYFLDTMVKAGESRQSLDTAYFTSMQKMVLNLFPDYSDNELLQSASKYEALLKISLIKKFSRRELDELCKKYAKESAEQKQNTLKQNKRKIAFLDWPCFMKESTVNTFRMLGYKVSFFFHEDYQKFDGESFLIKFRDFNDAEKPDIWFSYNYYPILAKCCYEANLKYISVVYDSPYVMIFSDTVGLPTNRVFLFDRALVKELNAKGLSNVFYTVLPGDVDRVKTMIERPHDNTRTSCDISFVGNLYNESNDFYGDFIAHAPEYLKGYLDGIINSQVELYDVNLIDELLTDDMLYEMRKIYPLESSGDLHEPKAYRYADYLLKRKVTQLTRIKLLESLGKLGDQNEYSVKLFTVNNLLNIPGVENMGIADYDNEMNQVFHDSRINLNISLKSIKTGIPLRCIDIMTSGGFLLSNYQEDLGIDFVMGEDFDSFSSEYEMLDKVEYYLSHEHERSEIAENGRRKMAKNYSFLAVFRKILER